VKVKLEESKLTLIVCRVCVLVIHFLLLSISPL
jgi:hypothetical protein